MKYDSDRSVAVLQRLLDVVLYVAITGGMAVLVGACATAVPITRFPATSGSRLVLSSPIEKGLVGVEQWPDVLLAPAGTYKCAIETEQGGFFVAPDMMRSGKMGKPKAVEGGIFIPKIFSSQDRAYLFVGKPPKVKRKEEFWTDLYVTEGCEWHLEASGDGEGSFPDGWLGFVDGWVKRLDGGRWKMIDHSEPVMRWSEPSGPLVTVVLAPVSKSEEKRDVYPQAIYCLVLDKNSVAWSLLRMSRTKSERFVKELPPDQLVWKAVDRN